MKDNSRETVLIGGTEKREIVIVDYDPTWPKKFEVHARRIRDALQHEVVSIEHVGSTSVPHLAAKPIIDIDLVVEDSGNESSYLPALEAAGYMLRVREPDWHEHRMMRTPELDVHVHIFSRGASEVDRHLRFRNRLRENVEDRDLYAGTKRTLANRSWESMNAYAEAKSEVIESILSRSTTMKTLLPIVIEEQCLDTLFDEGNEFLIHPDAGRAWMKMKDAAHASGVHLRMVSAFRSVARQKEIIETKKRRGIPEARIYAFNAPPGHSEHHSGRAIDVSNGGSDELTEAFERTEAFAWLVAHGNAFGFQLSYPRNNSSGIGYEPWHCYFSEVQDVGGNILDRQKREE